MGCGRAQANVLLQAKPKNKESCWIEETLAEARIYKRKSLY